MITKTKADRSALLLVDIHRELDKKNDVGAKKLIDRLITLNYQDGLCVARRMYRSYPESTIVTGYNDTWLSLIKIFSRIHTPSTISTFLYSGLKYRILNAYNRDKVKYELLSLDFDTGTDTSSVLSLHEIVEDSQQCPMAMIEAESSRACVKREIDRLSETERNIILLHFWHDVPMATIAIWVGVSRQRAYQIKDKALYKMSQALVKDST